MNYVHQLLSLRLIECNLHYVLPFDVHLDLGHLPDRGTWGFYLNHVIPHRASKSYKVGLGGVVGWPKILVSAPVPLELI